jgi:type IV pilus assembly protein PilM
MSALAKMFGFLQDPPPEFVFEIASDGIAMSRTRPPAAVHHVPLAPGVIAPSPVVENVLDPAAFEAAVRKLVPPDGKRGRRSAALILPDNSVRVAVLDFDTLPDKEEERRALIGFRLKKSVPFEIEEAALAYYPQAGGKKVVVALAPAAGIAHYETAFRAVGLHPGLVTVSSLAMLDLLPATGSLMVARFAPGVLTVVGVSDGVVIIARSLELPELTSDPIGQIAEDIHPTLAYLEDQSGIRPEKLFLAGFGPESNSAATRLSVELDLPVDPLHDPYPGLAGYLASLALAPRKAAA